MNVDNEIEISIPEKSKLFLDYNDFFISFKKRISDLSINDRTKNEIYKLCIDLVKQTENFNANLIDDDPEADPKQILGISTEYICGKLDEYSSAYRRREKCRENPLYVEPKELSLGLKWEMLRDQATKIAVPKLTECKFQYISIVDTLQALFLREDFREAYFKYNSSSHTDHACVEGVFKGFCCGKVFSKNQLFQSDSLAVRLHTSNDDFEVSNPLGSKTHKLSTFYFTIENIPPQFRSKSDNIFLFCLCYSDDLKTKYTDINDIWRLVVKDINFLETIGITTMDGKNVKGSIAVLSFDNLGINSAFGLVSSFNATFFCRFCVMPIKDCRCKCQEDTSKRRTIESYNKDLDYIENSTKVDVKKSHGIKMKCVLNELQHFHMLKNLSVDPMHDLNEGVVPFALKQLFKEFNKLKILTEQDLFQKFQYFDYGFLNQRNIPSAISYDKVNLGQNATQIRCLFEHVPFVLWNYRGNGDLAEWWKCLESLQRIFTISYSPEITQAQVESLRTEICIHLTALKNLGHTFIPKHHIITHYPTIIEEMGPVVFMSMFKFEREHKWLKSYMKNNYNFKNVPLTIAIKNQEHQSEVTDSFKEKFECGIVKCLPENFVNVHKYLLLQSAIDICSVKEEVKYLKYFNHHYKNGLFVFDQAKFHEIQHILKVADKYYFMSVQFNVLIFDEFLNSYKIERTPDYTLIEFSTLKHKNVYEKKFLNDSLFIISDSLILENSLGDFM